MDVSKSECNIVHKTLSQNNSKGLVTALVLKTKERPEKHKKTRYAIGNVSMKDLSNIIKEFEKWSRYLI